MDFSSDQVLALAPDANSVKAARKLAKPQPWRNLGHDAAAVWGECQGSTLYQVRVDLSDMAAKCSCPSGKFPWLERFPCGLQGVVPVPDDDAWNVAEPGGSALPCRCARPWKLLALSGGCPVDVFGEWDGHSLAILGAVAERRFHQLTEDGG